MKIKYISSLVRWIWSWMQIKKMKKSYCIIAQSILLLLFFLDMIGVNLVDKCLVTRSYKEDGIFFVIYLVAMLLFITKEQIGKWFVIGWMSMWFLMICLCVWNVFLFSALFRFFVLHMWYKWSEKTFRLIIIQYYSFG